MKASLKIIPKYRYALLCIAFLLVVCPAHTENDSLYKKILAKTLNYLELNQIKSQNGISSFPGEWPTYIENLEKIPFLGYRGKSAYDSNIFNTLFIHNGLAEYYMKIDPNPKIISMMKKAQASFHLYIKDSTFNFWPELPRAEHIRCGHINCTQRRANNFYYHYRFINDYANIYNDADDTSAGLLAFFLNNSIKTSMGCDSLAYFNSYKLSTFVDRYRDKGKRKTNWYNKKLGFNYRTGAYLTWFGKDRENSSFFNWFKPYHLQQNILFGTNEIDCVVNANILRVLYITGDTLGNGIEDSKKFLNSVVDKNLCNTCGVYYPSEFSFHYAVAKAIDSKVNGLNDIKNKITKDILEKRNNKGYWNSYANFNEVHVTLLCVNVLLLLQEKNEFKKEIEEGLNFVMESRLEEGDVNSWPAGIFFSGGSAVRYEHVWRSDAYTCMLAIEAIGNFLKMEK